MAEANLLNIFPSDSTHSGLVIKSKFGNQVIGKAEYTNFKPHMVSFRGTLDFDFAGIHLHGSIDGSVQILDNNNCKLTLSNKDMGFDIEGVYRYEMLKKNKMRIYDIPVTNPDTGKTVYGNLTIAEAHNHAVKINPDFDISLNGLDVGHFGIVLRPNKYD